MPVEDPVTRAVQATGQNKTTTLIYAYLLDNGPSEVSQIEASIPVSDTTIHKRTDDLEDRGLVEVDRQETNGRGRNPKIITPKVKDEVQEEDLSDEELMRVVIERVAILHWWKGLSRFKTKRIARKVPASSQKVALTCKKLCEMGVLEVKDEAERGHNYCLVGSDEYADHNAGAKIANQQR